MLDNTDKELIDLYWDYAFDEMSLPKDLSDELIKRGLAHIRPATTDETHELTEAFGDFSSETIIELKGSQ